MLENLKESSINEEKDSFDLINLSSDMNLIDINLNPAKELE